MADSPSSNSVGVVTISVFSNGALINDSIELISLVVQRAINRVPLATLVFADGDMPEQDFPLSNAQTFKPGVELEIKAGYVSDEKTVFKGVVVRHSISMDSSGSSLTIECRDASVAMTIGRKNANFIDAKDSDVISQLVSAYSALTATVEATRLQHPELVQYYCTDWDYMLSRAEANGLLVLVKGGELKVQAPQFSSEPVLEVSYGVDLIEFNAAIDARTQLDKVVAISWDESQQEVIEESHNGANSVLQGNLKSSDLSGVAGPSSYRLQTAAPMKSDFLKSWAEGRQLRAELARVCGRMCFQGSALADPGALITVAGVGDRFNGEVFVASVRHDISGGNWVTEVEFGMPERSVAQQPDMVAPAASGLVPAVDGLQIGIVRKLDADPDGNYRVQVVLPLLQAATEGVWARLAGFYASDGIGAFFLPEVGDEVVLGYLNNDPAYPVILGSLYSSKRTSPRQPEETNSIKALVTRTELTVEFDEDKKSITVITPGKNQIVISDDDSSILVKDQSDNRIELNADGILLSSPKDIKIAADGNIELQAGVEISIAAQSDVSVEGLNISHKAKASFSAQGSASSELSSSGQTSVKGGLVMIN